MVEPWRASGMKEPCNEHLDNKGLNRCALRAVVAFNTTLGTVTACSAKRLNPSTIADGNRSDLLRCATFKEPFVRSTCCKCICGPHAQETMKDVAQLGDGQMPPGFVHGD